MWKSEIKCSKCYQIHLFLWKEEKAPGTTEKYTSFCPSSFTPIYIQGDSLKINAFQGEGAVKTKIHWEKTSAIPEQDYLDLKKWIPIQTQG